MELYVKCVIFAIFMKNNVNFDPKKEINKIRPNFAGVVYGLPPFMSKYDKYHHLLNLEIS